MIRLPSCSHAWFTFVQTPLDGKKWCIQSNCDICEGMQATSKQIPRDSWTRSDWIVALLLFVGLASFYYATTSGITSSNDGSHYALVQTIIANRAFTLNQFDDFAEGNDIAITPDGRLFSDRPPGTALLGVFFYGISGWLPDPPARLPSRHDAENPRLAVLMMLPALAGAATAALWYTFSREVGISRAAALIASLMFALGTVHWKYSTVLFSHALSGLLAAAALYLAARMGRVQGGKWQQALILGAVLGFSVLVEYSNVLLVILVGIYLLAVIRPFTLRRILTLIGPLFLGGALFALFLAYYNSVNFGSPLTLSYAYAVNYPWAGQFSETFNFPLLPGLRALLYFGAGGGWCGGACFNQGLALLSPVLLVAIPGWYFYYRLDRRVCLLTTAVFLAYLLLFAKHHTSHGFTGDGRYLVPYLGLLVMPLGAALDRLFNWHGKPVIQAVLLLLVYALFFLSVRNIFIHIGQSYNYSLDLSRLDALIVRPVNWTYLLSAVFRNGANLPFFWVVLGSGLIVVLGVFGIWKAQKERLASPVR